MPVATLPAAAKIRELRLRISNMSDDVMRPMGRQQPFAAAFREIWGGEILFAGMTEQNAHAVSAFLESLDGKVSPFKFTMTAGLFSRTATHTAVLAAVPALGADALSLTCSPNSGMLRAGTLISVGDIDTDAYQVFEVLADVAVSNPTLVYVAPRVRCDFLIDATVALGGVYAKVRLAEDPVEAAIALTHGVCAVKVVEAL